MNGHWWPRAGVGARGMPVCVLRRPGWPCPLGRTEARTLLAALGSLQPSLGKGHGELGPKTWGVGSPVALLLWPWDRFPPQLVTHDGPGSQDVRWAQVVGPWFSGGAQQPVGRPGSQAKGRPRHTEPLTAIPTATALPVCPAGERAAPQGRVDVRLGRLVPHPHPHPPGPRPASRKRPGHQ